MLWGPLWLPRDVHGIKEYLCHTQGKSRRRVFNTGSIRFLCGEQEVSDDHDIDQREVAMTAAFADSCRVTVTTIAGNAMWGPQALPRSDLVSILEEEVFDIIPADKSVRLLYETAELTTATVFHDEHITITAILMDKPDEHNMSFRNFFVSSVPSRLCSGLYLGGECFICKHTMVSLDSELPTDPPRDPWNNRLRCGERRRKALRCAPAAAMKTARNQRSARALRC